MKINFSLELWIISLLFLIFSCESNDNPFVRPPKEVGHTGQVGIIYDIDSNKYKIIGIGTQIWMAENLKVTKLNNGTPILNMRDSLKWIWTEKPAYCWYQNDSILNKKIYGGLYNHYAVETNLLCPVNWHVPSSDDWEILVKYIGNDKNAGKILKYAGANFWNLSSSPATDEYGFSVLPSGYRHHIGVENGKVVGQYEAIKEFAIFWCNDEFDLYHSLYKSFNNNSSQIFSGSNILKFDGLSIRCVLDNPTKR